MNFPFRIRWSRLVVATTTLLALTACDLYPDSGEWKGVGTYYDDVHQAHSSCTLDVNITHTTDLVALEDFSASCGTRSFRYTPGAFNRRGTDLLQDGRLAGQVYPDGTVKLELSGTPYSDERTVITWTRIGDELHVTLQETGTGKLRTLEGWLHRER